LQVKGRFVPGTSFAGVPTMTRLALLALASTVALSFAAACDDPSDDGSGGAGGDGTSPPTTASTSTAGTGAQGSGPITSSSGGLGGGAEIPEEAPPWARNLIEGAWIEIGENTISDVDPANDPSANPNYPDAAPWHGNSGHAAVVSAWNGGAYAYGLGDYGSLLIWGGGHADYYGNEVYAFDLGTLTWSRLTDPYEAPQFGEIDAYPDGRFPDGTPVVPHTGDMLEYHPGTHSFVTLQAEVNNFGGYTTSTPYLLSLQSFTWRTGKTSDEHLAGFGWSAYDAGRDLFWAGGGGTSPISTYDPKTQNSDGTFGTWAHHAELAANIQCMGAYDPLHDAVIVTNFRDDEIIYGIDAKSPSEPPVLLSYGGDAPELRASHGWEWSATRESLVYFAGADVYELKAAADWQNGTWTWTNITNPNGTIAPDYADNGVFGRFRIVRYASLEIAITVGSTAGKVYAFRLPAR
jgi:hypothetical protein